ncbi:MAG: bifunctional diaminohydroxyphosphoribosylaminopyrimidine deaminase/5-amino-6-(5-phosphoribosylamino)uracil reductase RibD, partial [Synechococcaceae bacterium WB7_1B_046]|nr:bifunctional diaminohydroxyphosphoribosylaminopyrimidine deaminase/5-amino-6-(5-phosphoribosylamino)uracil reductase RibD [Synechococcaceae bacterium WB7_1B_046]
MDRALRLAGLADGLTSPNPLVGAVVLSAAGELVGEGYHRKAGEAHAELMALQQAGSKAKGGSLYVTLEPCCHQGRTPPCTDAVLSSGVKRVVVAIADPNPLVAGKGLKLLREAGLEVELGEGAEAAKKQNSAFLHRINTGKPEGILKWAMSLDGRTALPNGASQWISGPEARSWVHQLRSRCDAVIVGGGTVRADDPLLTSRGRRTPEPLRVVVSRELNLPQNAQLWNQELAPTLVAHGPGAKAEKIALLDQLGIERLPLDRCEPQQLMEALANRGCNRVLWECGPELAAGAIGQGCVQHIAAVIAPKLLGGIAACTPLGDLGFLSMEQA